MRAKLRCCIVKQGLLRLVVLGLQQLELGSTGIDAMVQIAPFRIVPSNPIRVRGLHAFQVIQPTFDLLLGRRKCVDPSSYRLQP